MVDRQVSTGRTGLCVRTGDTPMYHTLGKPGAREDREWGKLVGKNSAVPAGIKSHQLQIEP